MSRIDDSFYNSARQGHAQRILIFDPDPTAWPNWIQRCVHHADSDPHLVALNKTHDAIVVDDHPLPAGHAGRIHARAITHDHDDDFAERHGFPDALVMRDFLRAHHAEQFVSIRLDDATPRFLNNIDAEHPRAHMGL